MSHGARAKQGATASAGSTSRSLIAHLRNSDPDAWQRLVRLYTPLVCYWCRKLDVPAQDIADVTQEVFRAVAASISRFHRDRPGDTFRGWLRTITRSKVIDYIRARGEEPVAAGGTTALFRLSQQADNFANDEEDETPLRNALFHEALQLIRSEFREPTWKAFWLVAVDGKSPQEAGGELGLSAGAVRVAKCRVLQRLRTVLLESSDFGPDQDKSRGMGNT